MDQRRLILEGPQDTHNSTALKTLAGPYITDELADLVSKDSALQTRGVWIIELSKLDTLSRSEVSRIKAFMSRTTDHFRPPYGKRLIESPRQCVFAGCRAALKSRTGVYAGLLHPRRDMNRLYLIDLCHAMPQAPGAKLGNHFRSRRAACLHWGSGP